MSMHEQDVGRQARGWDASITSPGHSRVEWDEHGMSREPRGQRKAGRVKRVMKRVQELFRRG